MASHEIRFHEGARSDYHDAVRWYSARSLIRAARFQREIEYAFDRIKENPWAWPPFRAGTRRFITRPFRYSVVYIIVGGLIWIVAVAHPSREQDYWVERLADL